MRAATLRAPVTIITLCAALFTAAAGAPLASGASAPKPHFSALYWKVWVPDATNFVRPYRVKPGRRYTLCNMDRLNELEIDYGYRHAVSHGSPYALSISGPGGSQKVRFHTKTSTGTGAEGWGAGALPPVGTQPTEAGKYTVTIRQGSKTLMRASITLASDNSCS